MLTTFLSIIIRSLGIIILFSGYKLCYSQETHLDEITINQSIQQLDDDDPDVREAAYNLLLSQGSHAVPYLESALSHEGSLESRLNLKRLLHHCYVINAVAGPVSNGLKARIIFETDTLKAPLRQDQVNYYQYTIEIFNVSNKGIYLKTVDGAYGPCFSHGQHFNLKYIQQVDESLEWRGFFTGISRPTNPSHYTHIPAFQSIKFHGNVKLFYGAIEPEKTNSKIKLLFLVGNSHLVEIKYIIDNQTHGNAYKLFLNFKSSSSKAQTYFDKNTREEFSSFPGQEVWKGTLQAEKVFTIVMPDEQ